MVMKDHIANIIDRTLNLVEYADTHIRSAIATHPESARRIWSAFPACRPPDDMLLYPQITHKQHIDEIVQRAIDGLPLNTPTEAENSIENLRLPIERDYDFSNDWNDLSEDVKQEILQSHLRERI